MDPIPVLRGDPLVLTVSMVKDGDPWTDVGDYAPVAQVRKRASSPTIVAEFDIVCDDDVMTMTLLTGDLEAAEYVTDVEFTDPTEDNPELARFTWPGPGEDRIVLNATLDVTQTEGS